MLITAKYRFRIICNKLGVLQLYLFKLTHVLDSTASLEFITPLGDELQKLNLTEIPLPLSLTSSLMRSQN